MTVIADVTVIPMTAAPDGAQMSVPHRDVVIRDGTIEAIVDSSTNAIPEHATVIDGRGRFLIPGLIDMHVHFLDRNELEMFVANGVTTVRNLGDYPDPDIYPESWLAGAYYDSTIEVRDRVLSGEWLGPDMVLAGHILDGPEATLPEATLPIPTVEDIPDVVRQEHEAGYDYIKVYDLLPAEYFHAILEEAKRYDMPVVGHAPLALSFAEILESGLHSNEHLTMFRNYEEVAPILDQVGVMTAATGIWSCPTLVALAHAQRPQTDAFEVFFDQPEWQYLDARTEKLVRDLLGGGHYEVYMGEFLDVYFMPLTSLLHEAGAGLLLGTDAPFSIPGFAAHEELAYLTEAGLSPYEALLTGTVNAATSLGRLDALGTIEPGKRADLVLLDENPLEDIAHTREIAGVVLRGRWLPEAELDGLLDELARASER